jgi:uncharacterized membrane protein
MAHVSESIRVDCPVNEAYNQWTQFVEFPRFMDGIERVDQTDDTHLHGSPRSPDAEPNGMLKSPSRCRTR